MGLIWYERGLAKHIFLSPRVTALGAINKLCEQNGDFAKFVEDVKIDFESKRIHKAEYDEIPKDRGTYIGEKLGIEQSG